MEKFYRGSGWLGVYCAHYPTTCVPALYAIPAGEAWCRLPPSNARTISFPQYLQGKRGIEKPPFDLPDFIKKTGIMEMRQALAEKEEAKNLKAKMREKVRPKMGKIDIDYQKLHDAFFK